MSQQEQRTGNAKWTLARRLLWLQIVATVILWSGICLNVGLPNGHFDLVFFALLVWQCEMLGFWAGLGQSKTRFFWISPAIFAAGVLSSFAVGGGEVIEFQVFSWSCALVVASTTGLLRIFAGSLQQISNGSQVRDALQFGIQHVMVWTGVVAILFGLCRYLFAWTDFRRVDLNTFGFIICIACTMSGATVTAVWAFLGTNLVMSRFAGMVLVMAFGVALTQIVGAESMFTLSALIAQFWFLVSLWLLRMDRYRFVRSLSPQAEPQP
jgi:hypothetical protein